MTGKRPRALRRTSSESFIESGCMTQECSPLPEHPKEKLKPTLKEPVPAPRRLVIGFNPKPLPENSNGVNRNACFKASPATSNKSPTQRSGLESLLSMSRERKVNEGVGLGILAGVRTVARDEPKTNTVMMENQRDHFPIAIKSNPIPSPKPCHASLPCQTQTQSESIPIHAPGPVSWQRSGRPSHHRFSGGIQPLAGADGQGGRAVLAWLRQADREGERDTFLLRPSSFKSQVVVPDGVASSAAVHFLDACFFCKRHLVDGKDIYMYRGDKAFCSTECRTQQILLDERLENCSVAALKSNSGAPSRRNRVVASGTAAAA